MQKLLGAAVAAIVLLCASSASATRYITIDFDNGAPVYGTAWDERLVRIYGGVVANGLFYTTGEYARLRCCTYGPQANYLTTLHSITFQSDYDVHFDDWPSFSRIVKASPNFQTITFSPGEYQGVGGISLGWVRNGRFVIDRIVISAVPEPATWAMMITGFGLAGAGLRRRRPLAA